MAVPETTTRASQLATHKRLIQMDVVRITNLNASVLCTVANIAVLSIFSTKCDVFSLHVHFTYPFICCQAANSIFFFLYLHYKSIILAANKQSAHVTVVICSLVPSRIPSLTSLALWLMVKGRDGRHSTYEVW